MEAPASGAGLKLLLDEHYSPEIARQLRQRGHDVVSVKERPELVSLDDRALLVRMTHERRAIVTENAADFVPLAGEAALAGKDHPGVLLTSPKSMPRRRDTIGQFLRVLTGLLERHQAADACRNEVRWLP